MKTVVKSLAALLLLASCSADDSAIEPMAPDVVSARMSNPKNNTVANQVLLLRIDFLTHTFEAGKVLSFAPANSFTIASEYQAPGDFGGVTLRYAETGQLLFSGTIHWMGLGQMSFPGQMLPPAAFQTTGNAVPMPGLIGTVQYAPFAYYPDPVPYADIWNAIGNLRIVAQFRACNPHAAVHVFLYTPSVGVGNPADWDYLVMLKN